MQENVDRQYNILSLSGGGVRGLYTISVLAELEAMLADEKDQPDYNVAQHFDLICGTSIGGILALGLSSGRSARELYEIIDSERLKIFPQPTCKWWGRISKKFKRALSTPYSATPLKGVLESVFNDRIVGELGSAVLIPAVNYSTGAVQVFKTPHHPDFRRDWKYKLVDVALATSAAPTFFPIHKFEGAWYVDGGLAANSPALMAVHEARHFLGVPRDKIYLMQVGTMGMQKTANQTRTSQGYLTRWGFGEHLIELTLSANEGLHNQIAEHILTPNQILNIDSPQTPDQAVVLSLDNASDGAADTLKARARACAQKHINSQVFKAIVRQTAPPPEFYYGPNKTEETVS